MRYSLTAILFSDETTYSYGENVDLTCYGFGVVMLPACFVTSADKRQLWVYLCYLLIILPEAIFV